MRKISVDSFLDASGFSCRTRLNRFRSFSLNATSSPPIKICSTSIQVLEDLSRSKAEDFFYLGDKCTSWCKDSFRERQGRFTEFLKAVLEKKGDNACMNMFVSPRTEHDPPYGCP